MATSPVCTPPEPRISTLRRTSIKRKPHKRPSPALQARKAHLSDAKAIHQLIQSYTHDGTLLYRAYSEICQNIHTFTIVESQTGQFIGCAALHLYGPHLAEIRSIVVNPGKAGGGAGSLLVQSLLEQAKRSGIKCVCLVTRIPHFFERFHFQLTDRSLLRDKVRKDCQHCARRNACDEIAMFLGELPSAHDAPSIEPISYESSGGLVQLQL